MFRVAHFMDLTVRDLVRLFRVSEKKVYRWIKEMDLPTHRVHDQYRFGHATLLEWARSKQIPIPPELLRKGSEAVGHALSQAVVQGGVHYQVPGKTREEAMHSIARLVRFPEGITPEDLTALLLGREKLSSTGIGQGVAIPHVRDPIVLPIREASVSVCFLENPIDFGAVDGMPVHTFFLVLSPTIRDHLSLLSKIAYLLQDPAVMEMITRREPQEKLLAKIEAIETGLEKESK